MHAGSISKPAEGVEANVCCVCILNALPECEKWHWFVALISFPAIHDNACLPLYSNWQLSRSMLFVKLPSIFMPSNPIECTLQFCILLSLQL